MKFIIIISFFSLSLIREDLKLNSLNIINIIIEMNTINEMKLNEIKLTSFEAILEI